MNNPDLAAILAAVREGASDCRRNMVRARRNGDDARESAIAFGYDVAVRDVLTALGISPEEQAALLK